MNDIPNSDCFQENDPAFDEYGNPISYEDIKNILYRTLDEYGIIKADNVENILSSNTIKDIKALLISFI